MDFKQDSNIKENLIKGLTEKYGREREDIHVSDLIYCLREVYFRKKYPLPVTEVELMFFVDGARRHMVLEGLAGSKSEVEVNWHGVKGTVDFIRQDEAFYPVEIKTTRANKALPPHYFKQLGYYCAMMDVPNGFLLIQRLNNRGEPWEVWRVEWNETEFVALKDEILTKRSMLEKAFLHDDPSTLPKSDLVDNDGKPWKCNYCKYVEKCNAGDVKNE